MTAGSGKTPVAVLGATGTVGQRFLSLLARHPDFRVAAVAASDRSAGKPYFEACRWRLAEAPPEFLSEMVVRRVEDDLSAPIAFSALDAETARAVEPVLARAGRLVFTNASAHRMDADVPLVIPEINGGHLALLEVQRRRRGWTGGIVANANCSAMQLAIALAPLHRAFGVSEVLVTTLQSVSGAGYPGVPSLDILGNVLPDIPGEASKIEAETRKILGALDGDRVTPAEMTLSARTYRVAVEDGHTESVSVRLGRAASADEIVAAWRGFRAPPGIAELPSAPEAPVEYVEGPQEPQPRRLRREGAGMTTFVGGLEPCAVLGWKFTVVGSNTIRGAAGASLLNAELLLRRTRASAP